MCGPTSHGDGDHERFAHYVDKNKIVDSMVTGTPVTALCGKVWVPSRDPKRYPVCPTCKEIYEMLPPGRGRRLTGAVGRALPAIRTRRGWEKDAHHEDSRLPGATSRRLL